MSVLRFIFECVFKILARMCVITVILLGVKYLMYKIIECNWKQCIFKRNYHPNAA